MSISADASDPTDLLAINLARSSGLEEGEIADIHKKYGDHLYDKGDFDGAMQQFIKTIGKVQPSYVIRKVKL
jgi:Tfp pilus assembly protein PilF